MTLLRALYLKLNESYAERYAVFKVIKCKLLAFIEETKIEAEECRLFQKHSLH